MCIFFSVGTEWLTDKRAAAVTDHNSNTKSDNSKRKDNGVCRIAVGAELVGIGNINLVDNVI